MTIYQGTARLSGVGNVGTTASSFSSEFSSEFGGGAFAVVALLRAVGQATLPGVGAVTVPARQIWVTNPATLAGVGSVFADPQVAEKYANAVIPGVGNLSVSAKAIQLGSTVIPGVGSLVLPASQIWVTNPAAIPGVGALTVNGTHTPTGSALLAGVGNVSAVSNPLGIVQDATVAIDGAGAVAASGVMLAQGRTRFNGAGDVYFDPFRRLQAITAPLASVTVAFNKAAFSTNTPVATRISATAKILSHTASPLASTAATKARSVSAQSTSAPVSAIRRITSTTISASNAAVARAVKTVGITCRVSAQLISSLTSALVVLEGVSITLYGAVLRLVVEAVEFFLPGESGLITLTLDDEAAPMALLHPISIDPEERIYLRIDGTALLTPASEAIQSATFSPSSQAVIDSHTLVDSFYDATNKAFAFKPTGGQPNTQYAWTLSFTTLDIDNRPQTRKRTILVNVVTK